MEATLSVQGPTHAKIRGPSAVSESTDSRPSTDCIQLLLVTTRTTWQAGEATLIRQQNKRRHWEGKMVERAPEGMYLK